MKKILSIIFISHLMTKGVDTENIEQDNIDGSKVEPKPKIIANDVADALIASLGIDVNVIPNKHLLHLREKINKINFYSYDLTKYMEILHDELIDDTLNKTKFYEALNDKDDFKFLRESNPTSVYFKLKQKINRDDILNILKRNNISIHNPNENDEEVNMDKLIIDPYEDKSNFSGSEYVSPYWDPSPELKARQDMVSGRRLFKGKRTFINNFPFMVSVHIMGRFFCGGALYWHDLVLTSASCLQLLHNNRFFRENPKVLNVRIGSNHSRIGGELIGALEVYFHPGYNSRKLYNNIAAIRLERHIRFKHHRVPKIIEINQKKESVPNNIPVLLLGWGVTRTSKKMSYEPVFLQQKMVPIYPNIMCKEIYGNDKFVMKTMFCAGSMTEGNGACDHDAGGPAIFNGRLYGIISFGTMGCGAPNAPTVFTHVGVFSDWINEINNTHPDYYIAAARTTTTEVSHYTPEFNLDKTEATKKMVQLSPIWSTPMPEEYHPYSPVESDIQKSSPHNDFDQLDEDKPESPVVPEPTPPPNADPEKIISRQRKPKKQLSMQKPVYGSESIELRAGEEPKEFKFHFGSKT